MNWLANIVKPFFRGLGDLSPDCKQAARLQSAALDRKLPFRQRVGLKIHLLLCKWCRRYGKQIRFLCNAARDRNETELSLPDRTLSPEARNRIKARLQAEE